MALPLGHHGVTGGARKVPGTSSQSQQERTEKGWVQSQELKLPPENQPNPHQAHGSPNKCFLVLCRQPHRLRPHLPARTVCAAPDTTACERCRAGAAFFWWTLSGMNTRTGAHCSVGDTAGTRPGDPCPGVLTWRDVMWEQKLYQRYTKCTI